MANLVTSYGPRKGDATHQKVGEDELPGAIMSSYLLQRPEICISGRMYFLPDRRVQ